MVGFSSLVLWFYSKELSIVITSTGSGLSTGLLEVNSTSVQHWI